jgi:CxxC motif-containing protein
MGCTLVIALDGTTIKSIKGNQCKKGLIYAESEFIDPRRTVTTTVKVRGGIHPLVPVYTSEPFPTSLIFKLLNDLRVIELEAPVQSGQSVLNNVYNTKIDVITSRSLPVIGHSC